MAFGRNIANQINSEIKKQVFNVSTLPDPAETDYKIVHGDFNSHIAITNNFMTKADFLQY